MGARSAAVADRPATYLDLGVDQAGRDLGQLLQKLLYSEPEPTKAGISSIIASPGGWQGEDARERRQVAEHVRGLHLVAVPMHDRRLGLALLVASSSARKPRALGRSSILVTRRVRTARRPLIEGIVADLGCVGVHGSVREPPGGPAQNRMPRNCRQLRVSCRREEYPGKESLVNDASALIAYRYTLIASITSGFVFWKAGLQFLLVAGGGVLTGLLVGAFLIFLHKRIYNNAVVETSLTLLTPLLSYVLAEQLHLSGILAVVTTGLMISWRSQEIFSYQTRMRTEAVWDTLTFLLNGFLFILIGLQLPFILEQLTEYRLSTLIGYGLLVSLATILARMLWVFSGAYAVKLFTGKRMGMKVDCPK